MTEVPCEKKRESYSDGDSRARLSVEKSSRVVSVTTAKS
jgi:hypothetical protein